MTPLFLQLQESKAHKLAAEPGSELQAGPGLSTSGYLYTAEKETPWLAHHSANTANPLQEVSQTFSQSPTYCLQSPYSALKNTMTGPILYAVLVKELSFL